MNQLCVDCDAATPIPRQVRKLKVGVTICNTLLLLVFWCTVIGAF